MFKKIAIGIALIVIAILAFAMTKPDSFAIERTTTIEAPPQVIYSLIEDFHRWESWSPWEKRDPAMQRQYGGPAQGPGAVYEWTGNSDVGAGRMEIAEATPPSRILIKLDFLSPMETSNVTEFELTPRDETTEVRWNMSGPNQFVSKVMQVFVSMDALVGKDFESGLAALKAEAEKLAAQQPAELTPFAVSKVIDAPRAAVWKAWTDPKEVSRWWGPKGYTSPVWKIDLREGGKYLGSMRGPDGKDIWSTGRYLRIIPAEELQFTDQFADERGNVVPSSHYGMDGFPADLVTTVTLADAGPDKTNLTVQYEKYPGGELRDMTAAGWNESLDKLADMLGK